MPPWRSRMPHESSTRSWVWALAVLALASGARAAPGVGPVMPPGPIPGDPHMTLAELRALAVLVGFPDPDTAAAIAMAESSGYPHAQGDPRGPFLSTPNGSSSSFGLWQVHAPAHPEFSPASLLDATYNAHAALL